MNEIKKIESNALIHIEDAVNTGNDRVVDAIKTMHADLKEILGRIDGKLSR